MSKAREALLESQEKWFLTVQIHAAVTAELNLITGKLERVSMNKLHSDNKLYKVSTVKWRKFILREFEIRQAGPFC